MTIDTHSIVAGSASLTARLRAMDAALIGWYLRLTALALAAVLVAQAVWQFAALMQGGSVADAVGESAGIRTGAGADEQLQALAASTVESWGWNSGRQLLAEAPPEPSPDVEVKETRLNMRLQGIVFAAAPGDSVAIIEIKDESGRYSPGDKLPVAPGVVLQRIDRNRVLLDNNGVVEELVLFDTTMTHGQRVDLPLRSSVIDHSGDRRISMTLGRYRKQLLDSPGAASELMSFRPHIERGELVGYAIGATARSERDFSKLGLEQGDIVTHVNGVHLTDLASATALYRKLDQLSELRVELIRQGSPQELIFRLP